ncbi:PRC-barrel domain-containing protein [Actinoplanes auranticolor]|uniref:PRC-barrel domain-containing protein n=1 Tax=Actinoplanes auranticolor TaxID=47988 RepID=UPI001FE9A38F|nr:PRC-barrel domain-containing protein [Actinoplanes auranticolor]
MASRSTTPLVKLSDSRKILSDPAQDLRGRTVCDAAGEALGEVDDLLIDEAEREVRFLQITHGGILGFGATASLIPTAAVTRMTDDTCTWAHHAIRWPVLHDTNPPLWTVKRRSTSCTATTGTYHGRPSRSFQRWRTAAGRRRSLAIRLAAVLESPVMPGSDLGAIHAHDFLLCLRWRVINVTWAWPETHDSRAYERHGRPGRRPPADRSVRQ